ncbi:hypothetical protein [Sutterella sp.]|uniref:hypothetical protein n=1 Tax=Sutterella sp. TaxID=1981025 RepID=UPI003FD7BDC9
MTQKTVLNLSQAIRIQLALTSTELPNLRTMETNLWNAVKYALEVDETEKELHWLRLGPQLSSVLRTATPNLIGMLAESSVCSFIADIREDDFRKKFGHSEEWSSLRSDARINYYIARFASIYWCSVRDFAVKSRCDCQSVFHLPLSIIDMVADSTTSQIIDFCHGEISLQKFQLTSKIVDCINVARHIPKDGFFRKQVDLRLVAARAVKSNHCALFNKFRTC